MTGFEPTTFRTPGGRSYPLSYKDSKDSEVICYVLIYLKFLWLSLQLSTVRNLAIT